MAPKKVLMLGAGFVTKPTLDILSESGIHVTVACRTLESAQKLSEGVKLATAKSIDVTNSEDLQAQIAEHDAVISLIPYTFHAAVIQAAVKAKVHVITTSYVSPAMLELDQQCKDAGITVMNEIGLDPGIDHLYAVKVIEKAHAAGSKILSFKSYCGGLPAPECSNNPLGYKFSWSSRGVLLALRNAASFYQDGKVVNVAGPDLMATAKPYPTGYPGFNFVAYPNRDSTPYKERYNIPEAQTIVRGTLRYQGFPQFVKVLVDIGFLSDEPQSFLNEAIYWKDATQKVLGATSSSEKDLLWAIQSKAKFENTASKEQLVSGLKWIGMFSDEKINPRGNPLDVLCAQLELRMQFEEGERDLVFLQHLFEIEHKDGKRETLSSTLVEYGTDKYSAMAKLVGVPCAVAVKQVLDGTISEKGVLAPMNSSINEPLMKELKEKYGIFCTEKIIS